MNWRRLPALVFLVALSASGAHAQLFNCSTTPAGNVCKITAANASNMSSNPNVTYAWDSTVAGPKSLPVSLSCPSPGAPNGFAFIVKDELGTAGTYPITVTPNGSDTIDSATTFLLNSNFESITFQCDGAHNWVVE